MDGSRAADRAIKPELLELMARAYTLRTNWMAGLTEEAKAAPPGEAGWGAKATLAHMARWNRALLTALELKAAREPVPYQWEDMHGQNARLLEENASRTWADICAEAERVYHGLYEWVKRLSEDQLAAIDDFAWHEQLPLWHTFLGNVYFHYLDHLAGYYDETGETERAADLRSQEREVDGKMGIHWR